MFVVARLPLDGSTGVQWLSVGETGRVCEPWRFSTCRRSDSHLQPVSGRLSWTPSPHRFRETPQSSGVCEVAAVHTHTKRVCVTHTHIPTAQLWTCLQCLFQTTVFIIYSVLHFSHTEEQMTTNTEPLHVNKCPRVIDRPDRYVFGLTSDR